MNKIRINIGTKLFLTNLIIVVLFLVNAGIQGLYIEKSTDNIEYSNKVLVPSILAIDDFVALINDSKLYVTNWVLVDYNKVDKQSFDRLYSYEFPSLKDRLSDLKRTWKREKDVIEVDSVILAFDIILSQEKKVIEALSQSQNNYFFSPFRVYEQEAKPKVMFEFIPHSESLVRKLELIQEVFYDEKLRIDQLQEEESASQKWTVYLFSLFLVVVTFSTFFFIYRNIVMAVRDVEGLSTGLSTGKIPNISSKWEKRLSNDEIGDMARSMIKMIKNFNQTVEFAKSLGKGNYDFAFTPLSKHDELGNALISMRHDLAEVSKDAYKRHWTAEGQAQLAEVLRGTTDDLIVFYESVLSFLVSYLKVNQGAVFIVQANEGRYGQYMELEACIAWDKEKKLERKIHIGEGLAGQAWQERDTVYLTDIPEDHIKITSGLGEKSPTSILIVPLIFNDIVFGVLELASFHTMKPYEIQFVEKAAENFASSISTLKTNQRTKVLLRESTEMTEELRAQEEEMRQNVEELQATQEELNRRHAQNEETERIKDVTIKELQIQLEQKDLEISNLVTHLNKLEDSLLGDDD